MSDEQRYDDARRAKHLAAALREHSTEVGWAASGTMMQAAAELDRLSACCAQDATWYEPPAAPPRRPWPFWLVAVLGLGLALAIGVAAGEVEL